MGRDTTIYSNGLSNDSLFFLCFNDSVKLRYIAQPNSTIQWFRFNSPTNDWTQLTNTSTIQNTMQVGGYRVIERDSGGVFINESVAWACRLPASNPANPLLYMDINLNNIAPGCSDVSLNWISVFFGLSNITNYYNKPKTQIINTLPFDSNTTIEACMSIYHAYMNDLQLYLIGPASCGRPVITLAEGITSTDSLCPQVFGDPLTLCFTNEASDNFNYCLFNESTASSYSSYGWNSQPIVWDSLYGCDMNENDWHIQVSDCFGEFIGVVSQASIDFSSMLDGISVAAEYVLTNPAEVIINECAADTSDLPPFNRRIPTATPRGHDARLQLSSNPPIPGLSDIVPSVGINGGSYTIPASAVGQNTQFYAEIIGPRLHFNSCGHPIQMKDSSYYDYIEPDTADISGFLNEYCVYGNPDTLISGTENGYWTGSGMAADSSSGVFYPDSAGVGSHTIIFRRYTGCKTGDTIVIAVDTLNLISVTAPLFICDSLDMLTLNATIGGSDVDLTLGSWSGQGVINESSGWVDPSAMSEGPNSFVFSYNDGCVQQASLTVNAQHYLPIALSVPDSTFCSTEDTIHYTSNVPGVWSGPGMVSDGTFNPMQSQEGNISITFNPQSICYANIIVPVTIVDPLPLALTLDNTICDTLSEVNIIVNYPNGTWDGANSVTSQSAVFPVSQDMSGPYTIQYMIEGVCTDSIATTINIEDFQPIYTSLNDTIICLLSDTMSLSSNFIGEWTGASNNGVLLIPSELGAGVNIVTFQPASFCHLPINYSIDIRQPISINLNYDSLICNSQDSLHLFAEPTFGSWSSDSEPLPTTQGQAILDITPSTAGTFIFYYELPDACLSRDTATVFVEPYMPLFMPFQDTSICSNADTTMFESNYSGIWSGPGIIDSNGRFYPASTSLTQFEISFIPASVCHSSAISNVTIVQPPNLEIDIQPFACSNSDSIYPYSNIADGLWGFAFPFNSYNGGIFPPDVPPGQHVITYSLSGVCPVMAADTIELINYLPVIADFVPAQICALWDSVLLYTNQPGQWSGSGIISDSGWYSPAVLDTGYNTVQFHPASPCVNDTTFEIVLVPATDIALNIPSGICLTDEPIELLATPASGTWNGPGILNNTPIFDPSLTGASDVILEYSLDDICNTLVSQSILVADTISLALTAQTQVLCPGEQTIIASNLSNLNYSTNNVTVIGNNVYFNSQGLATGDYIIAADYTGICQTSDEISIHVFDTLTIISSVGPICYDAGSIPLTSNISNGTWSGSGVAGSVFYPGVAGAGSHLIHLLSDSVCTLTDSIVIDVQSYQEVVHSLPAEWCDNAGAISLEISPAGGDWTVSVPHDDSIHPDDLAGQTVQISYFLDSVCDLTFDWEIIIQASPDIIVSEDTVVCPGTAASLWVSGAQNYLWNPASAFADPLAYNPNVYPQENSVYQVVGINSANCFDTMNVNVGLYPQPDVNITVQDSACYGDMLQLSGSGALVYEWLGNGISEYNIPNPTIESEQTQEIFLTGTDINGCVDTDSTIIYIIHPVASISPESITGVSPFEVTFTNQSQGDTFYWNFGNGEEYNSDNMDDSPTIIFEGETNYTVMLVSTQAFCKDTTYAQVEVIYDSKMVMFPNIVTNNGDGKNDVFRLLTQNIEELQLEILNRWGQHIASIVTPDGHWSAKESNDGTYFYSYTATGKDGRTFSGNGYFTVISGE